MIAHLFTFGATSGDLMNSYLDGLSLVAYYLLRLPFLP